MPAVRTGARREAQRRWRNARRGARRSAWGRKYNRLMALLSGKHILVTGLLSNRSIAYGIAKVARREGAEIALTYQNKRFRERADEMARELGAKVALPCEVTDDREIAALYE